MEKLEDRRLLAADPFAYANQVQTLPFALDFTKQVNGVFDAGGQSIGFTRVQTNKNGDQYQPSLLYLNTASGELDITTKGTSSSGSNYGTENTLTNGLETEFNADTNGFTITGRLKGPLSQLSAPYDGGAVYFGPDQDNYVKLDAEYDAGAGQTLQFTDEQNATTHTVNSYANIGSFSSLSTLDLRLTGNAGAGTVTASYSVNGGAFVAMPGTLTLSGAEQALFFNGRGRAGIFAATHNDLPAITVPFGRFEIDAGTPLSTNRQPYVTVANPADGTNNVTRDSFVSLDFNMPNGGIDPSTLYGANNVQLLRTADHAVIASNVVTTGGGDAIILTPKVPLDPSTSYTVVMTGGLKDVTGTPFVPYTETFTTGTAGGTTDPTLAFQKVALPAAPAALYTSVRMGPDGALWASSEDGKIFRFAINSDGTLASPQVFNTLATYEGTQRMVTGFAFDPKSTAGNPILWVSNSFYSGANAYEANNAPDFTGKITVMSGANLQTVQDAVINLPRSIRDHSTEQSVFGPDGALYISQGSTSSSGAPDLIWGNRSEHLLSAAILRLDTSKLNLAAGPLDAKTTDAGGTYNPFATNAPLTIYASGVRNAFTLLWANGYLYAPANGASADGNTPAYPNSVTGVRIDQAQNGPYTGPNVPAINGIAEAEDDWLFNIQQGGYYGHPDPARAEYVLNGGHPTTAITDPAQIPDYPVGVLPDRNWRGSTTTLDQYGNPTTFDFGQHRSPDGIIQYSGTAFNGALNGKLLVTEYSGGADIAVLTLDAAGHVSSIERGIAGFTGFVNPINLAEDTNSGYIYVADYGAQTITMLKPVPPGAKINAGTSMMTFNAVQKSSGGSPSPTETLTITNTGTVPLTFPSTGFTIVADPTASSGDTTDFTIVNRLSLPSSIQPGQSFQVQLNFTANDNLPAGSSAIHSAFLQIQSNDPNSPVTNIALRGLSTTGLGGASEPSLAAILRTYEIPTIVGDGANDSTAFTSTFYPNPPGAGSQEVGMQRLVKAGSGPVTITTLASFDVSNQPALRFGYYVPGDPTDQSELFTISQADSQSIDPTPHGATSFDPGSSEFSLYSTFPSVGGEQHIAYSEDVLNTWDTTVHRKFRFFPLETATGTIVPNAYVFAAEDNQKFYPPNIQPYDSNDIVGIIYNVKAAPGAPDGAVLGLQNLSGVPSTTRLVFNRIQNKNPADPATFTDIVHDTSTLQIQNTGDQPLTITGLQLSDTTNWQIQNPPALPLTIAPGATYGLTVKFVATSNPPHTDNQTNDTATVNGISVTAAGGVWSGTLAISSNDSARPARTVQLAGYWQNTSENENEPGLQTIVNRVFGYGTNISNTYQPSYPNNGTTPVYYGEEVVSGLWNVADSTLPVGVRQLDAYHNQWTTYNGQLIEPAASIGWYAQGSSGSTSWLFQHQPGESQSLLPTINGSTTAPAAGSFSPGGTFGWNLDGEFSQDSLNTADKSFGRSGHSVRFYPARDGSGNLIPNTWLVVMDYENSTFDNSDYQDNVYLVTNMRPAAQAAAPVDLSAVGTTGGISLQWGELSYANAVSFNVYRATSINGPYTQLNGSPLSQPGFLDPSASDGTTWYYKVTAVDATSGVESIGSNASAVSLITPAAPSTPTGLGATANSATQVTLSWTASTGMVTAYHVERSTDGVHFNEIGTTTITSYVDNTAQPNTTYTYHVRAENLGAFSGYSNTAQATTPQLSTTLTSADINASMPGSTTAIQDGTDYDVTAGGPAIYNTADGFRFVYKQQVGDFDVKVRINSITTAGAIDQAGLMARATLDPGSPNVFVSASPSSGYRFKYRTTQAGQTTTAVTDLVPMTYPNVWLRLQRSGSLFTGYYSTDGVNWITVSSLTLTMTDPIYIGMAAASNTTTSTITAQFRSFEATTLPGPVTSATATAPDSGHVNLTWSAAPGATSYTIQRKGPSDSGFVTIASNVTGGGYADSTVQSGPTYSYRVIAVNATGPSAAFTPPSSVYVPLVGDINRDGTVNMADLLLLTRNFGKTAASWDQGDLNGDGTVDSGDFLLLTRNFGKSAPATGAAQAADAPGSSTSGAAQTAHITVARRAR